MQTQDSTISTFNASKYFQSLLPEIKRSIVHRLRTVALVKGRGAANDNAFPTPPEPPVGEHARRPIEMPTKAPTCRGVSAETTQEMRVGLRPITVSEVRATLLQDDALHTDILGAVLQDYLRAVEKGRFKGPEDRALLFEIVRCQTIKAMRPRAKALLRTVVASDGSAAIDHIPDPCAEAAEDVIDRHHALHHLRSVLDELSDEEQELLDAKLDGRLTEYAHEHGEPAGTIRCRAKRLYDRIVLAVQGGLVAPAPALAAA